LVVVVEPMEVVAKGLVEMVDLGVEVEPVMEEVVELSVKDLTAVVVDLLKAMVVEVVEVQANQLVLAMVTEVLDF
jgi:predicted RecB family endonuclease